MKAIDLFSGWGGFTLGAQQAGVEVVWAANHWDLAVKVHAANHPTAKHICQDLNQANWTTLPRHDIVIASPACQPHSSASQPNPTKYHDAMRSTAFAVIQCAEVTEPKAIIIENVVSFQKWKLYPLWLEMLKALDYSVQTHVRVATDHGVPQRRERLFIVATRKPCKLNLPGKALREPAFGPHLERSAGGWRAVAKAQPGAQQRIRGALMRHPSGCLVQHVTGHPGVALTEAIRTITTKDQWVLARRGQYRWLTMREIARGMGFPDSYEWPAGLSRANVHKGLGNAVPPPMARDIVEAVAGVI